MYIQIDSRHGILQPFTPIVTPLHIQWLPRAEKHWQRCQDATILYQKLEVQGRIPFCIHMHQIFAAEDVALHIKVSARSHLTCLHYTLAGTMQTILHSAPLTLQPYDHSIFCVPAGLVQPLIVRGNYQSLYISFSPALTDMVVDADPEAAFLHQFQQQQGDTCIRYMPGNRSIQLDINLRRLLQYRPENDSLTDTFLYTWVFDQLHLYISQIIAWRRAQVNPKRRLVADAEQYIQSNLHKRIGISTVARHCFCSESKIRNLFLTETGSQLGGYIYLQRMLGAADLLLQSDMDLEQIAGRLSYNGNSALTHAFKKHYNMSPQKYRQLHRKK